MTGGRKDLAAGFVRRACAVLCAAATALATATAAQATHVRVDADNGIAGVLAAVGNDARSVPLADTDAPLGRHASLLRETRGAPLTLAEARMRRAAGDFTASTAAVPNLGTHAPPLWLHLGIHNAAPASRAYRIYIVEGWADRVDAWLVRADGRVVPWQGGDARAPGRHLRPGFGFAFDAELPPGRNDLFVRADSVGSAAFALRLVPLAEAARVEGAMQHWLGLVHGYLIALVTIFGLLWLALREASVLRYVAYAGSYLYMHLAYSGVAALALWPDDPAVARFAIVVGMTLFSSAGLWFAREFLGIREWAPRLDRVVAWIAGGAVLLMAAFVLTDSQSPALAFAFRYITAFTLLMVLLGVLGVRRRRPQAWAFLVASLAGMTGAFITTLAVMGRLPFNGFTFRAMELGVMSEAAIWALALGLRLRRDRRDRAQALQLAHHDPLTGLCNRRGFLERALPLHHVSGAGATPLALLLVDIDHFKALNDRHGHEAGDLALVAIADRLRAASRVEDVIARWGGEEFVLLLPGMDARSAGAYAERLRTAVGDLPIELAKGEPVYLTVSIGVAAAAPSPGIESLLRQADGALYAAKQAGRDRVHHAEPRATEIA